MTLQPRILLVDDDATLRSVLASELSVRGFAVSMAESVPQGASMMQGEDFDVAVVDLRLRDESGLQLVQLAREKELRTEIIVLTGHGSIDTAIEAMRNGAFDYLRKPCPVEELQVSIGKALERQRLIESNAILRGGLAPPDLGVDMVGTSAEHREVLSLVDRVASSDTCVLIMGETGVGKGRIAKLIHARSSRARHPLVVVDCAAFHEELLNSELFGHEKGAYTGAVTSKHGLFEVADGGTIFLDEIGDVSPATQVKLLRVLESCTFRRVGGTREVTVDVRFVAATNRDLSEMISRSYFRKDLFFRLNTVRIDIPALRDRPADIPVLAEHFLARMNERFDQKRVLGQDVVEMLATYSWPGNVRELMHVIERAVLMASGDEIHVEHLSPEIRAATGGSSLDVLTLDDVERRHVQHVLRLAGGNRARAARLLGISERTLYRKLKEYGLGGY